MFTQAKLILKSYFPKKLEKGMWFLIVHHGQVSVYQLGYDIRHEQEKELYLQNNGAPVEPYIYLEGNPNVPEETSLMAEPEQIGWFDEGEHTDEMHDITIKEINNILDNDGWCEIDVEEEHLDDEETHEDYIKVVPVLLQDKVIIRYEEDEEEEEEIEEEEEEEEDDDPPTCGNCNGSGEGMWDGSRCSVCGGDGVIIKRDYEDDDWDDYHPNYDY